MTGLCALCLRPLRLLRRRRGIPWCARCAVRAREAIARVHPSYTRILPPGELPIAHED